MSNAKKLRNERQAILSGIRARQKAKERRTKTFLYGGFGLVLAAIITAVAIVLTGAVQERNALAEAAKQPIEGVSTYDNLSRNHVQEAVQYPQEPGVGGDHSARWVNCAVYTAPVNEQGAVHSLEHGAVWITYTPALPQEQINALTELAKDNQYVLLSPDDNQTDPITATAWGQQLPLQNADDPRIRAFVAKNAKSPDAPEPNAPCTGGTDG
ncbi:DUF3105 domain-containing protein [Arthrobacter sp. U41]|uniref:DUF3105 domain-containing protein n=1 Tax=Arthrobacter sp. U41 TaxID=1849032 RepID=UPI0008592827|nr:DUF3105 domain-containing protein [Arthrobacter sp. U41]AOT05867.1 hypothetical protein ASPU41_20260 [Arthrobacter sp. U41]